MAKPPTPQAIDFRLSGLIAASAIRWLFNAEKEDFISLFGTPHVWNKYINQCKRNEGDLICSLDTDQLALLAEAAFKKYIPDMLEAEALLDEILKLAKAKMALPPLPIRSRLGDEE